MRCRATLLLAALLLLPSGSFGATIVAPSGHEATEGNSNNCFPILCTTSMRYQQGYDSSFFGASPIEIQEIAFRVDGDLGAGFARTVELQLDLSTSANEVGALSTTFASNVGADNTIVLPQQNLVLSGTATGSPNAFDVVFTLATPFLYDPLAGDLLLDVRIFGATGIEDLLDAAIVGPSELQRVYLDGDVNAPLGTSDPGFGLVTQFTFVPEPSTGLLLAFGLLLVRGRKRT